MSVERRIAIRGGELAYEDHGAGDRPLVLVHGFMGFRDDFAGVIEGLLPHAGRVVALDLRGHGASARAARPEDYALEALADDLREFLAALGIARCDLLGHSMGGMLVQRVALAEPARVASLILMSTTAEALGWVDTDQLALAARIGREAGMAQLAALLRARAPSDPGRGVADRRLEVELGPERFWGWRDARVAAADPEAVQALGPELKHAPNLLERLAEIVCPTLVLVGDLDAEFVGPAQRMQRALPDAQVALLPAAGHQPQLEARDAWLAAVAAHLERARR
jgi:pimeloyl-ACP methyl ester carboxylesterase